MYSHMFLILPRRNASYSAATYKVTVSEAFRHGQSQPLAPTNSLRNMSVRYNSSSPCAVFFGPMLTPLPIEAKPWPSY